MKRFLLLATTLASAAVLLQACAPLAPGFRSASNDASIAVSPSGFSTSEIDPPPPGAITEITPELIKAQRAAVGKSIPAEIRALVGKPEPYKIGPGDVIGITVYDHPELVFSGVPGNTVADPTSVSPAPGFIVSDTGMITFPFVGTIQAAGLSVVDLESSLVRRLSRVFKDPQLSTRVTAFRSKRVFVEGEVKQTGLQVFTDIPMTVAEALSRAGGIATTGDRSSILLTRAGKTYDLDLVALADAGIEPTSIPLLSGDQIYVRGRDERKVAVMGEVTVQTGVLMRNGRLSLTDALTEVQGLNLTTANPRQIYVIRSEQEGVSIFHLDAKTPTALAIANGFALRPKDVVYVDPVPLVQWNRVLNLILPTATTGTAYRDLGNRAAAGR